LIGKLPIKALEIEVFEALKPYREAGLRQLWDPLIS